MSDQTARYYRLGDTVSEERYVRAVNNGGTSRWTPVVVLDPDDYVTLGRLADAFSNARWGQAPGTEADPETIAALQTAVRELTTPTPPKPDEPIGLGALVRDDEGDLWQLDGRARYGYPWTRISDTSGAGASKSTNDAYEHIAAVEVIFEGVNP